MKTALLVRDGLVTITIPFGEAGAIGLFGFLKDHGYEPASAPPSSDEPTGCPTPGACSAMRARDERAEKAEAERDEWADALRSLSTSARASASRAASAARMRPCARGTRCGALPTAPER